MGSPAQPASNRVVNNIVGNNTILVLTMRFIGLSFYFFCVISIGNSLRFKQSSSKTNASAYDHDTFLCHGEALPVTFQVITNGMFFNEENAEKLLNHSFFL